MRIALCQIDTTVGDLAGNRELVLRSAQRAHGAGADLAVFCELTLTGYPPRDLLDRPAFVDQNLLALAELAGTLPQRLAVLVGFVDRKHGGDKTALYNAAALVRGGRVEQVFYKRLLPTYDVFDDARYFEPAEVPRVFAHAGVRFGVTICEDAWNDAPTLRRVYAHNPVAHCVEQGADVIINVAASPFTLQKRTARPQMLAEIARRHGKPLVFINSVGGNDDIVFDGSSALFGPDGGVLAQAAAFDDDLVVASLGGGAAPQRPLPQTDAEAALAALVRGTRDYARKCGFRAAVVGLSGGIDSALVATIAARALGPENVLGVSMPTRYSSPGSGTDAAAVAGALGIALRTIDIDPIFQGYLDALTPALTELGPAPPADTTTENLQARIRGNTLMAISNRLGHLLLTTGNKSELAVGYCTLYGDMAGGLAVISDLPKTFVYEVARQYNREAGREVIPQSTFDKPPSAELRPNQTDQDTLPPYDVLDAVIERLVERGESTERIAAQGYDRQLVERVAAMVRNNEYKRRQMPPGLIVTSKAFGPGRRYPIAQRFRG